LPNWSRSARRNSADFGSAATGSNGSSSPRSAAVRGMNWAMPRACSPRRVSGPTASGRNRLSCQMTRAKNSSGRPLAEAADSMSRQIDSERAGAPVCSSRGRSCAGGGGSSCALARAIMRPSNNPGSRTASKNLIRSDMAEAPARRQSC